MSGRDHNGAPDTLVGAEHSYRLPSLWHRRVQERRDYREQQRGAGRIGYQIQGWTDAGGLKWPSKLQNLGLKTEIIEFSDIAVGEPDDATYVPTLGH